MHSFSAHGLGARDHVAAILLALAASGFVNGTSPVQVDASRPRSKAAQSAD